jgi:CheY-like chemotaxis protein
MNKFEFTYIIDDDPIFVMVFKKILSNIDYFNKVDTVKNGYEALEGLKTLEATNQKFPDIIFLDLNMPVLDGWQFLEALESLPFKEKLNIHVISSTIDKSEIERSKTFNVVKSFIHKPTSAKQLIQSLNVLSA